MTTKSKRETDRYLAAGYHRAGIDAARAFFAAVTVTATELCAVPLAPRTERMLREAYERAGFAASALGWHWFTRGAWDEAAQVPPLAGREPYTISMPATPGAKPSTVGRAATLEDAQRIAHELSADRRDLTGQDVWILYYRMPIDRMAGPAR